MRYCQIVPCPRASFLMARDMGGGGAGKGGGFISTLRCVTDISGEIAPTNQNPPAVGAGKGAGLLTFCLVSQTYRANPPLQLGKIDTTGHILLSCIQQRQLHPFSIYSIALFGFPHPPLSHSFLQPILHLRQSHIQTFRQRLGILGLL